MFGPFTTLLHTHSGILKFTLVWSHCYCLSSPSSPAAVICLASGLAKTCGTSLTLTRGLSMEPSETVYAFEDIDGNSGQVKQSYVLSRNKQSSEASYRIDEVTEDATSRAREIKGTNVYLSRQYLDRITEYLSILFLPIGYPHSVTKDYTNYQIFDSVQAFASSIAGLLSSRAVLQSLDVISSSSSGDNGSIAATSTSAATAATLLSVLQTTLSNMTSILFASHAAPRISSEVKYYRFLADVVNDAAFVLDLLAPALASSSRLPSALSLLPLSPRALVLCTSSMLRAICGVAGGSSKAVLSTHFARNNPESVGDLNAKDGSQETVVGLLGMWVGGIVVSRVESTVATWCWMIALLCMHLWANYQAVLSVRLKSLNRERASMVCGVIFASRQTVQDHGSISIETVGSNESVLGTVSFCHSAFARLRRMNNRSNVWRNWKIGMSMQQFLQRLELRSAHQAVGSKEAHVSKLIEVFNSEAYLLHWNHKSQQALVVLKVNARPVDQFKAWLHATCIQCRFGATSTYSSGHEAKLDDISILINALTEVQANWEKYCLILEQQGWDLGATNLENVPSRRLKIS